MRIGNYLVQGDIDYSPEKCKLTFEVQPENYPPVAKRIAHELLYHTTFRQASGSVEFENHEINANNDKDK